MRFNRGHFQAFGLFAAAVVAAGAVWGLLAPSGAGANPLTRLSWKLEWPKTDFSKTSIDLGEIISGGPPKDGIPSIDDPRAVPISRIKDLAGTEPVVGLIINGKARAYPLRVLTWHEIVNDELGGVACPP
jgi:hypothetical protein